MSIDELIWHVEEVSPRRGQRFVNFFLGHVKGGRLRLGNDPELDEDDQVLLEVGFFTKEEIRAMDLLYPEYIRDEIWMILKNDGAKYDRYKMRIDEYSRKQEEA